MFKSLLLAPALAAATLVFAPAAQADHTQPQIRLRAPVVGHDLPRFDMRTRNIGYGEQVVYVRPGGLAFRLGIEEGDLITRMNHKKLTYHGSWWEALDDAMHRGGHVLLRIQDHRTGHIATRHIDFPVDDCDGPDYGGPVYGGPVYGGPVYGGPVDGPVTPKAHIAGYGQRIAPPVVAPGHDHDDHFRDRNRDRDRFRNRGRDKGVTLSIGGGSSQFRFRLP